MFKLDFLEEGLSDRNVEKLRISMNHRHHISSSSSSSLSWDLGSSFEHSVVSLEGDGEFVVKSGGDGKSGKTLQLSRGFVAEKEGDSTEILPVLALAPDLYNLG